MEKHFQILLLAVVVALSGCKSTVCMESKNTLHHFSGGTQPVFVSNPELHLEYEILKASAIYRLSSQPEASQKLTLRPIKHGFRCGNPMMIAVVTLGIIPGYLPGSLSFEYNLEADGKVESYVHHLPTYERFSIWEWLVISNEKKTLAKALAWSSRQECKAVGNF